MALPLTSNGAAANEPSPQQAMGGSVVSLPTLRAVPLAQLQEEERAAAEERQAQPFVTGVAGHIHKCWAYARDAKLVSGVRDRLLKSVRARRGEYDPEKLTEIRDMGGSEIYAGVTGVKCRAAASWLRDTLLGTGSERPWSIRPTPMPDLPEPINDMIVGEASKPIQAALMMGQPVDMQQSVQIVAAIRDQAMAAVKEEARRRADRMAEKMEDQMLEGGFLQALDEFIDDVVTFPTAFLKGPIIRKQPVLKWQGDQPVVSEELKVFWERVSPFDIYPSPAMSDVQDGFLIEKHRLSRVDLQDMKGVPGYDSGAIDMVLRDFNHGLQSWLFETAMQSSAEGKSITHVYANPDELIDALQYWGTVQGQMLLDWGMDKKQIPDPLAEYHVEAWLIGNYVIKAVLNYDPLRRKPYYAASYENVPGNIWGNSVADLVRDSQDVVNAAARSLVNNMALSSGPQVAILTDRLAQGEDITNLQPWRVWQMTSDPMAGTTTKPIEFFQPNSNINELLAVYEKFSQLADEYSGIPRYLTGDTTGGAGRTASGLSMLISNAGKSIKQVINNIDMGVMKPALERLYYHNMRYEKDPELKGDVQIEARGSSTLIVKEAAQVRRNEFLAATANPIDMQIVGVEGRAAILREVAKNLDMDVDKVVPPVEVLREKFALQNQMMAAAAQPPGEAPAAPSRPGQELMDGAPQTDNFSPPQQG